MTDHRTGLSPQEIEARILEFIQTELLSPPVTAHREDDLLSGEILDSVAVLRLATYVAEEFRIHIQPTDFVIENFQNAVVLTEYVLRSIASRDPGSTDSALASPESAETRG
ncbi:MAG: acyl carrier protein [Deltaproteobacteria bacterium]|nr:acyl carrier protein [Deltaproteobacteria bacterium]